MRNDIMNNLNESFSIISLADRKRHEMKVLTMSLLSARIRDIVEIALLELSKAILDQSEALTLRP